MTKKKKGGTDKQDVTPPEDEGKGFHNREESMDAILASRDEELQQEVEDGGGEFVDESDTVDEKKAADDQDAHVDDIADDDDKQDTTPADSNKQTVELVVDGEKKTVTVTEAIAIAQKNLAADRRLQEAEEKRREAEEYLKSVKTQKPEDSDDDDDSKKTKETKENFSDEYIKEKRAAYLHAMNYGEPDEQEAAMIEYEKAVIGVSDTGKPYDEDELVERVAMRATERMTGEQINDRFDLPPEKGGFSDIRSDPDLMEVCYNKIQRAIDNGADGSKWETYRDIAEGLREKFLSKGGAESETPASDAFEEKKKRKRKVDNLSTVSDTRESSLKNANPISSQGLRGSVIADMAKTRPGQHNY